MAFLNETGLNYLWSKLKQKFLSLTGGTLSGDLTVSRPSATNTFLGVSNSVHSGDLRVGSTGNFGLYDKNRGTWLIRSDANGAVYLSEKLVGDVQLAQGVTNGWVWRKYASGIAECAKIYYNDQMTPFGSYRYVHEAFPFAFNAVPVVTAGDVSSQRIDQLAPIPVSVRGITKTGIQAVLSAAQTVQCAVALHAIGTYDL